MFKQQAIFILSLFYSIFLFAIEYIAGYGVGYHIDSLTYLQSVKIGIGVESFLSSFGAWYYTLVSIFHGNATLIILFQIVLYSFTNLLIYRAVIPTVRQSGHRIKSSWRIFFLFIILFDPYRAHLSVHVLKEVFVIFFLVAAFLSRSFFISLALGVFAFGFTHRAVIYFLLIASQFIINRRVAIKLMVIFTLILASVQIDIADRVSSVVFNPEQVDMVFRDYDAIPTFSYLGQFNGGIVRAISWAMLASTGSFILLSPSLEFLAISILPFSLFVYSSLNRIRIDFFSFVFFLSVAALAFMVPGFTTFYRYVFPIIVIFSIHQVLAQSRRNNKIKLNVNPRDIKSDYANH